MAVLACLCSALCFLLPETKDAATLENMDSVNTSASEMVVTERVPFEPSKEKEELGELLFNQECST